jgi:hypothetical protein
VGEPFEAAALRAIEACRFEPARRGERAIPARFRYAMSFSAPSVDAAGEDTAVEAPAPSHAPLAAPEPAGEEPAAPGASAAPENTPAAPANSDLAVVDEGFGATAQVEAPPREVTRRTVAKERLLEIPGTSGDALRAIEVMPGVGRTSTTQGDPILRGAGWNDSRSYVAGVPVPLLFHFGGVKSAFNSRLLDRVDLYPGNFSVRFGRATGGVVDAIVRGPAEDRLHAVVDLSLLDASALVESPLGEHAGAAIAARRSNVDLVFDQVVPDDAFNVVAAPLYWDYQALSRVQLGARHRLDVLAFGSRDSLKLFFKEPSALDPGLRGDVGVTIEYHRAQARLRSTLADWLEQDVALTWGKTDGTQAFGAQGARFDMHELFGRAEWRARLARQAQLNVGLDFESQFLSGRYVGGAAPQAEGDPSVADPSLTVETKRVSGNFNVLRPAGYAELELRPVEPLLLVPGVRADYYSDIDAWSFDPRLSARYEASAATTLKTGVGLFSQSPLYYEALEGFGNPELKPTRAWHASLGLEQRIGSAFELGAEGFFKHLESRVVSTPGGAPPGFVNDGTGRIFGGEFSAQLELPRTYGYLAYTLSRSERNDRGEGYRPFEKDQTHVLSVTGQRELGRGWELGMRFRLVSGDPYTPVNGAVYDATVDQYRPLYGAPYSRRNPVFHQLDVRVEKEWTVSVLKLAAYLDLQNAYNAQHSEGFGYSYDYSQREAIAGLPIFPNLGFRGEL